jgi:competence protein ComGF
LIKIPSSLKSSFAASQNEQAFTLIEMLFSFTIFTIIVFFISPIFQMILGNTPQQGRIQDLEWEVFCSQMKKEIRMSTKVQVSANTLILTEDVGTVVYEKYQNILRRRVYMTGHEVLLQNIANVNFTMLKNSIRVAVKDLNGKDYTVTVYSFLNWG